MAARLLAAAVCAVSVAGCTSSASGPSEQAISPSVTATAASEPGTPSSRATASPTTTEPGDEGGTDDVLLGTGTVTVDGTEVPVSGDCDLSREFGAEPVEALDGDVDVLLMVDNLTGDGGHEGPFALQVRLLGRGELVGRNLVSEGGPGEQPGATLSATYEGAIEVAELQDRREREFADVATLHLEASQRRTAGEAGPRRRDLVVDVACPISRPAG